MRSHAKVQLKSLGTLSPSEKTKPRSPDMTGKLKILKKTLREIINTHIGWRRLRSERGSVVIQLRWREVHDLGAIAPLSFGGSTISKRDDSGGLLQ
jgi:hypothetical protein